MGESKPEATTSGGDRFTIEGHSEPLALGPLVARLLAPLASLKVTVATFALAIFLIFAGTLAQVDQDIWVVMGQYFRTPIAKIPLQIFVPRSIPLSGWFYFPGGFTIGSVMLANLLAAHAMRFKPQARGLRLLVGGAVIAAGVAVTWGVIHSGSIEGVPLKSWSTLWSYYNLGVAAFAAAAGISAAGRDRSQRIERWTLAGLAVVLALIAAGLYLAGDSARPSDASLRILWQLTKGWLAGLVLLAGCSLLFRKRAGVVLLHGGVALMMINELIVYGLHEEGQMHIREGQTANFVQDIRSLELAAIDRSHPDHDDVVAIPQSRLPLGERIELPELPFDVELVKFLQNTDAPRRRESDEKSPADAGAGREVVLDERRPTSGADASGKIDMSAAYVKLTDKGDSARSLGTYLLSLWQGDDAPERVTVDGKTYDLFLRFKRTYKPYAMHLDDVRFDKYMGTNTPMNYSSQIHLKDPTRAVDRDVKIWMNNPLRYAGETFYQSSVDQDERGTGLQVVKNTGWMIPYVACMIIVTGMVSHFRGTLTRFLRRAGGGQAAAFTAAAVISSASGNPAATAAAALQERKRRPRANDSKSPLPQSAQPASVLVRFAPLALVGVCALWIAGKARLPEAGGKMDLVAFGELPVVYQGRPKPFDTLARNTLRIISKREYFANPAGEKRPAIEWLLDVISEKPEALQHKVFRIENLELLDTLGLERRPGAWRYSIEEFRGRLDEFDKQVRLAMRVDESKLSTYQRKVIELNDHLRVYSLLVTSFRLPHISREEPAKDLLAAVQQQREMRRLPLPLVLPPEQEEGEWQPFTMAWTRAFAKANLMGQDADPATLALTDVLREYAAGRAQAFNRGIAEYHALLEQSPYRERLVQDPAHRVDLRKIRVETFYNYFDPLWLCTLLYVVGFLLTAVGWLGWPQLWRRSSFWLLLLAWLLHLAALLFRIYISGRGPVTNLYSSAVFIAWGTVGLGLVLEWFSRLGIGNAVGALAGFGALVIAYCLSGDGDTFTVLQAVLDTNFWLWTHVTCVSFGYAATYVAGLLGLVYVLGGVFTTAFDRGTAKELARMVYGIVCFAILFSFFGTVLGGLWADDSWGRFWGWDPKENGALIIVLWNALVLHARWDGMIKDRGLALLAVAGNICVSWSWFGVNQLGKGLHSYGFTEGIALALALFVISQLAVIVIGLTPKRLWRSNAAA